MNESVFFQSLEINRKDVWALHAFAHVLEMKGAQQEGREFLQSRANDWQVNIL